MCVSLTTQLELFRMALSLMWSSQFISSHQMSCLQYFSTIFFPSIYLFFIFCFCLSIYNENIYRIQTKNMSLWCRIKIQTLYPLYHIYMYVVFCLKVKDFVMFNPRIWKKIENQKNAKNEKQRIMKIKTLRNGHVLNVRLKIYSARLFVVNASFIYTHFNKLYGSLLFSALVF